MTARATALGYPRLHFTRIDSTSARARSLAQAGAPHGTLVTAAEQTAGRGRQGRTWSAPPGQALLMSLVLRDPPELLPLRAGVAVAQAIGQQAMLKWPNDVVLSPAGASASSPARALRKVAGLLAEGQPSAGWAVLGVGVNVAVQLPDLPAELAGTAATLGRRPADIEPLLRDILASLERWLSAEGGELLASWRDLDALYGRAVEWEGGRGRARGVDGEGRLIVSLPTGAVALSASEVHLGGSSP